MTRTVAEGAAGDPAAPDTPDDPFGDREGDRLVNPRLDLAAGFVLAALALFALLWLIPNHTKGVSDVHDIAPGFFPRVAAFATLFLALGFIGHRFLRYRRLKAEAAEGGGLELLTEIGIWSAACVLLSLGLAYVGYPLVSPLLIGLTMVAAGERRWWMIGAVALGVTAATYFGAELLFSVELP